MVSFANVNNRFRGLKEVDEVKEPAKKAEKKVVEEKVDLVKELNELAAKPKKKSNKKKKEK